MGDRKRSQLTAPDSSTPKRPAPDHAEQAGFVGRLGAGSGDLHRSAGSTDALGGSVVDDHTIERLRWRAGTGRRLPSDLASDLGGKLGTDLSRVRLHTDREADTIARTVQAKAFTLGQDIYFTSGAFAPSSGSGKRLLAHELSHVAQQARGSDSSGGSRPVVGRANDPTEVEADAMADAVLSGRSARPVQRGAARAQRCSFGHGHPIRRLFGIAGITTVASTRERSFQEDDQEVPPAWVDLADSLIHTKQTIESGKDYGDDSTESAMSQEAGASGALAGLGAVAGVKTAALGVYDMVGAGTQLRKAYKKTDWDLGSDGLGAHSDSIGKNAGAVAMEKGVTGTLFGAFGAGSGVTSAVGAGVSQVGDVAPILGDTMSVANALSSTKSAVEDSVASGRLGGSRRGIKRLGDLQLPLEVREKRFAAFITDVTKGKRSDRKRYMAVVAKYRQQYPVAASGTSKKKRADKDWDETDIHDNAGWTDPTSAVYQLAVSKQKRRRWLEFLRDNEIKDFGKGSAFRKEFEQSDAFKATKRNRAIGRAGGSAPGQLTQEQSDYLQARDLHKMAKFGQRRKAETATVHSFNALGNAADAAGTLTAGAGDMGATKLFGKTVKASVATYKGLKTLVKRGRRVHKLRTTRNEAEYGGKQRNAWWGVKQYFAGNLDERMRQTRQSLKGKGGKASKDFSNDPDALVRLLRRVTLQCDRRINDFMACLFSSNAQVRAKAKKILHIVAESNLAGALARIKDAELDELYKVHEKCKTDQAYQAQHQPALKARKAAIKEIIRGQLAGIGG